MNWEEASARLNRAAFEHLGQSILVTVGGVSMELRGIPQGDYQRTTRNGLDHLEYDGAVHFLADEFAVSGAGENDLLAFGGVRHLILATESVGDGLIRCLLRRLV
jgi:hypothetical protein